MTLVPDPRRLMDNRGQSLIEFSLAALMLVMLLIGVVEISRMLLMYTTVANAAKAGTRYAIVNGSDSTSPSGPGNDPTNVITAVRNVAQAGGLSTANLTVTVKYSSVGGGTPACNTPGCWVSVHASYPYNPLTTYFPIISTRLASTSQGAITW